MIGGWEGRIALTALVLAAALALILLVRWQRRMMLQLSSARAAAERAADTTADLLATLSASQAELAAKSEMLEATLNNINQGLMMVAGDGTVPVCNRRALELLDLPGELMEAKPSFAAVVEYQRSIGEFASAPVNVPYVVGNATIMTVAQNYERTRPNGTVLEMQTIPLAGGGMVRTYTDITERRHAEKQIRYFAHHDGLTNLVNRTVFQAGLQRAIDYADENHRRLAILYLDLDGFKAVNDTHGHSIGDKLLIDFSDRLRRVVREGDTVARIGGDEFAVIQPLSGTEPSPQQLAARILGVVGAPYEIDGAQCMVGVSIGIAFYPDHAQTAESLLRLADLAMYRAKTTGKGRFCLFDQIADRRVQKSFVREQDLRLALAGGHFELEYQPIVDSTTLEIKQYEALLRCRLPNAELLMPAEFITVAERSGLMIPIGLWVLQAACTEALNWPESVGLAVNISPVQLTAGDLPAQITAVLKDTGLSPDRLNLEVTEGVLLEGTSSVTDAMLRLKGIGVRLSLDDFGTAHSGLSYLRRFQFDSIKIDRFFVQDAVLQLESRAIVTAIIDIARAFRMGVVGEGVETEEQLVTLRELGCEQVQGFFTGRPGPSVRRPAGRDRAKGMSDSAADQETLRIGPAIHEPMDADEPPQTPT